MRLTCDWAEGVVLLTGECLVHESWVMVIDCVSAFLCSFFAWLEDMLDLVMVWSICFVVGQVKSSLPIL